MAFMHYEKNQSLNQPLQVYKIVISCVVALFFGISCSTLKYTNTQPKQPRQEYYSLSKEANTETGNIDTNLIYINEQDWAANGDYGSKQEHLYVFMKFGGNGMAYYSNYSQYPFTEASSLNIGGQYCYYRVRDNELELEFYDHLAKHFKIWYAKIYSDRIQFYKYKLRVTGGAKGNLNFVFDKVPIKYTKPLVWPE